MNRILIDTNVYISAVVFGGKPALVLQIADALGIELAVSAELEAEFRETLADKFGWPADSSRFQPFGNEILAPRKR